MKILQIVFLFLIPFLGSSQIVSKQNPKKKNTGKEISDSSDFGMYFHYGYGSSFRVLKPSTSDFGKELGERANEKPIAVSSFQFGVNSKISKNTSWDLGLQWLQFGEQYNQRFEDSLSIYETKYSYISVPVRIQFEYGKRLSFFCATGLQAQFLSLYRNKSKIQVGDEVTESTEKNLKNANSFQVASTSSLGIKYSLKKNIKILLGMESVYQLSNTFNKQSAYSHHPYYIQGKIGLQWNW